MGYMFAFHSDIYPTALSGIASRYSIMCRVFCTISHTHSIFFKPGDTFLSECRLVLSYLAWNCLVFFVWVWIILNISYVSHLYEHLFHIFHIYNIPQGHCANRLQPVLLSMISMYGAYFEPYKTRQEMTRQGKASHCVSQTRQEGCPLVLRNSVSAYIATWVTGHVIIQRVDIIIFYTGPNNSLIFHCLFFLINSAISYYVVLLR